MPAEDLHPAAPELAQHFLETYRLELGRAPRLPLHEARMRRTLLAHGSEAMEVVLSQAREQVQACQQRLSEEAPAACYRLSLTYSLTQVERVRLIPYTPRAIQRLCPQLLPEDFTYSYKYADRSFFDQAHAGLSCEEEPLFVRPSGELTDTTFTNVVLEIEGRLFTPQHPLLAGTQRAHLLASGVLTPAPLTLSSLQQATRIYLINALLPLEEAIVLPPPR